MRAVPSSRSSQRSAISQTSGLDELVFYISRAFYAYVTRLEAVLKELELDDHVRPGMGAVLFALFEEDGVIIKNIAARTRLAPSSLGRLLAQMEREGLIERNRCDADGRAVRIRLTTLGWSLEGRCRQALAKLKQIVERGVEPDELRIMKAGFERVIENLRAGD